MEKETDNRSAEDIDCFDNMLLSWDCELPESLFQPLYDCLADDGKNEDAFSPSTSILFDGDAGIGSPFELPNEFYSGNRDALLCASSSPFKQVGHDENSIQLSSKNVVSPQSVQYTLVSSSFTPTKTSKDVAAAPSSQTSTTTRKEKRRKLTLMHEQNPEEASSKKERKDIIKAKYSKNYRENEKAKLLASKENARLWRESIDKQRDVINDLQSYNDKLNAEIIFRRGAARVSSYSLSN